MTSVGSKLRRSTTALPPALRLVWDAAGRWTLAWIALLVVQGLLPLATVWLTRSPVDGLVAGIR
ncbi:MAG: hypothetical protein EHM65_09745 [Acidobacteriales bacterium]|nr:MAG: hypothetical protein EHM65_09745 [Terriglobales bacterium]